MRTNATHLRFISRSLVAALAITASLACVPSSRAAIVDPLANGPVDPDLFTKKPVVQLAKPKASPSHSPRQNVLPANFQTGVEQPLPPQPLPAPAKATEPNDPCAAAPHKPLSQLGISIAQPDGKFPTDLAAPCWVQVNQTSSPSRCWPAYVYNWDATCFYHNPLYFEEINLERYGYQCGDRCCCCSCGYECCLQPAVSAAHFYGSLLALPYCMAAECPGDCVYTLGHYRPGSCNPRRCHWPPFDPIAAASAGGIWTGLIFAIP